MHEFNESVMNQFEYRILKQLLRRALEICSVEKAILVLFQNESWSTTFHMKINLVCKTMDVQEKFISIWKVVLQLGPVALRNLRLGGIFCKDSNVYWWIFLRGIMDKSAKSGFKSMGNTVQVRKVLSNTEKSYTKSHLILYATGPCRTRFVTEVKGISEMAYSHRTEICWHDDFLHQIPV